MICFTPRIPLSFIRTPQSPTTPSPEVPSDLPRRPEGTPAGAKTLLLVQLRVCASQSLRRVTNL